MSEKNTNEEVVLFGEANFRNKSVNFGIKMDDRRRHMYVIGKTGMGKSELLKNIAIQDIKDGRGLAFLDPHGDIIDDLLNYIPEERIKDVIYLNPADLDHPVSFNVMEQVDFDRRHLVADGMMAVFKKIWVDAWSARMEYILNNTILALLESPGSTLLGVNRMLADKEYRKRVVEKVTDPEVKAFWVQEFAKYTDKFASEATAAIQNKIGQFISNALIRNIVGQPKSSFDMREAIDQQKILLIDISKGRIGEDASRLLGALLITKIQLAAMSRVDIARHERKDFVLVVDEFQNFATASFANILSEARKFNLSLLVAHQYVAQMEEEVRDAVFGNVGTIISFRVGAEDAELLEKEFSPEFLATDIVNLGKRQIYLKLMIDGITSRAFSARTMDTLPPLPVSNREIIIEESRRQYSVSRDSVEKAIADWHLPVIDEQLARSAPFPGPESMRPREFNPRPPIAPQQRPMNPSPAVNREFSRPTPTGTNIQQPRPNPNPVTRPVPAPVTKPISLSEALGSGPVDFSGRKLQPRPRSLTPPRPKPDIDVDGLRKILEDVQAKK